MDNKEIKKLIEHYGIVDEGNIVDEASLIDVGEV
ncbi:hypothetical protein IX314_000849 [Fusobacterium sp. DD26]|nr:hypothetical protein [Fusobacterium sp. DD45]MBR8710822.1 hypothetical protein [Fusobacterium sp. DD28]MBR8751400.1 hypothetical protein [Fusobacterium sp. DD26]